jgi:hypothetical protein
MIFAQTPTEEERALLISYYKKGPNTLVRARAQAIVMSAHEMRTPRKQVLKEVYCILGVPTRKVTKKTCYARGACSRVLNISVELLCAGAGERG